MSDGLITLLAVGGFILIFPLFWMAILWIIATVGGWKKLAGSYAADAPASGVSFNMASARLGLFTSYSHSLRVTVSSTGIHLQPFILMRTGHAPLFIPWDAVSRLKLRRFSLFSSAHISIMDMNDRSLINLILYGKALGDALAQHAPPRLGSD